MKLCKNVFLDEVHQNISTGEISVTICANANNESSVLFFTFEPQLNCNTFKEVCKNLGIPQKRLRQLLIR